MIKKFFNRLFCRHLYSFVGITIYKPQAMGMTCITTTIEDQTISRHYVCDKCGKTYTWEIK